MSRHYLSVAVAALAAVGMGLAADDKEAPRKATSQIEGAVELASPVGIISPIENDRRIARWLAVDNDSLRGCGEMAEDHSDNARVKELARAVVADHKRFHERLNAFIQTVGNGGNNKQPDPSKTATLLKDDGRSRDSRLAFRPTDFLEVKESVCRELRAKAEKEFKDLKGAEFDHAFLAHMTFGHEALIAGLDAMKGDATQHLQTTLDEFRQVSEQHLKNVRHLRTDPQPKTVAR